MLRIAVVAAAALLPAAAFAEDWGTIYGEVYGGGSFGLDSTWGGTSYDMDMGPTMGATLGVNAPVPGLSFDLDVMGTSSRYSDYHDEFLETLSVMVDAEYSVPLNETFDLYGSVGVGMINLTYKDDGVSVYDAWGAGYQLAAGARAHVVENVSVFTELKFQDSFAPFVLDDTDVTNPKLGAVAGLRFGF